MGAPATAKRRRGIAGLFVLALLLVVHNDFWLWDDARRIAGLPIGLFYHVAYCGVVSAIFWWIIRFERGAS